MAAAESPPGGTGVAAAEQTTLDFSGVRAELGLPTGYPDAALAEVKQRLGRPLTGNYWDAADLPLVTIDPPGAKDLDQAVLVRRRRRGYRVHYAIADVAAFIAPGGVLDAESRRRGQTIYLPDGQVPLHPPLLAEDAASLLPGKVRPAVLWTFDLDSDGVPVRVDLTRALVRSVAQLDYATVQRSLQLRMPHPSVELLPEVGRLRRAQALRRGAIELGLPEQQVEPDGKGGWRLTLRPRLVIETWNAEVSLLTGMCAAEMMVSAGIGVLRTVPAPEPETVDRLRKSANRIGVHWPEEIPPAAVLAGVDPGRPEALAGHAAAPRLLRGAGYTAFGDGAPANTAHAGIGASYAHVTAPLRRLVDRYCTEVCLAISAGREVPSWVTETLAELPSLMGNSDRVASQAERACIAQTQAWSLAGRVGEVFPATVLRAANGEAGEIFIADPPVIARCTGEGLGEGQRTRVRLVEADPTRREVSFEVV